MSLTFIVAVIFVAITDLAVMVCGRHGPTCGCHRHCPQKASVTDRICKQLFHEPQRNIASFECICKVSAIELCTMQRQNTKLVKNHSNGFRQTAVENKANFRQITVHNSTQL